MKSQPKKWTISELDGSNPRQVTLAQFMAEHAAKVEAAKRIFAASVV